MEFMDYFVEDYEEVSQKELINCEEFTLLIEKYRFENKENWIHSKSLRNFDDSKILSLNLSHQGISALPIELVNFKKLEVLDLSNNKISFEKSSPDVLESLKNVKALNINNCNLKYLPVNFHEIFPNLYVLYIGMNKFEIIPEQIFNLNKIVALNFRENRLSILENYQFENLDNLMILNFHGCGLKSINIDFGGLKKLTRIYLGDNLLKKLPRSIFLLSNLIGLYAFSNRLDSIGDDVFKLSRLKYLSIGDNNLREIPSSLTKLNNLVVLNVQENSFRKIPETIYELRGLKKLRLSKSNIQEVDKKIGNLINLSNLDLSGNYLDKLPPNFKNLKSLEYLDISRNSFFSFPEEVLSLGQLKFLYLSHNSFKVIPSGIKELKDLLALDLSDNSIENLPLEVTRLADLIMLDLQNNNLDSLPLELTSLRKLLSLIVGDNPFKQMPEISQFYIKNTRLDNHGINISQSNDYGAISIVEFFIYLNKLTGIGEYSIAWDIPDSLKTGFQQYLSFFSDYVEKCTGVDIQLKVSKVNSGLALTVNSKEGLNIDVIDSLLHEYVTVLRLNKEEMEDMISNNDYLIKTKFELRQLVRDLNHEKKNLVFKVESQLERIIFLNEIRKDQREIIDNLKLSIRYFNGKVPKYLTLNSNRNEGIEFNAVEISTTHKTRGELAIEISKLISENDTEIAIIKLLNHYENINNKKTLDFIILQSSRVKDLAVKYGTGEISYEQYLLQRNKINSAILNLDI